MDVFLSYAAPDRAFAQRLADDLTRGGLSVWFDRENIEPGSNILTSLLNALRDTRIFMPLISQKTSASPWFSSEIAAALAAAEASEDRRIVPVVVERDTPIPPFLRQFSAADLSDADQYRESVSKLISILKRESPTSALPSPDTLKRYNEIVPDFAEKMLKMAEEEGIHRRQLERAGLLRRNLGYALGASSSFALVVATLIASISSKSESPLIYFISGVLASNVFLGGWIALRSVFEKHHD